LEQSEDLKSGRGLDPNWELEPDRRLKSVRGLKCSSRNRNGFTLVEIIVALCIVAILTAIAIPGFKKATEDFRLNATLEDTLDIMKACRAYYLIFNEWPPNVWDDITDKLLPLVPRHLIDPNRGQSGGVHRWSCRPLGKAACNYDLDCVYNSVSVSLIGIVSGTADWNKCYNKFKSSIGERYIGSYTSRMRCILPESAVVPWENRYY
jgi:prepilin-type N-terminal cleavage/methylation domain-containing protein